MIEIPRAALTADKIATVAEFFSFGTNDLTQTTFGMSRDDAGKILRLYVERDVLDYDPFQRLDEQGVGRLMKTGVELGRKTRPNLKIGICGEHGGEPNSVKFCHRIGPRLRELLALPGDGGASGSGPGGDRGEAHGSAVDRLSK